MPPFSMSNRGPDSNTEDFNLDRFVLAQRNIYSQALSEIVGGHKTSHWMWFIFPQVRGLGQSYESRLYGIVSLDEARAYLSHDILGHRLGECLSALLQYEKRSALEIFGPIDEMKLRSSLTLFKTASNEPIFDEALERYFCGKLDGRTLEILGLTN